MEDVQDVRSASRPTDDASTPPPARRGPEGPPPRPLAALVADARAGCPRAFEHIYRSLAGQVSSYLRWHRASDPDGLTNDVFVQVHRTCARSRATTTASGRGCSPSPTTA